MKYMKWAEKNLVIEYRDGAEVYAKCPYHNDNRPSFAFNVSKGVFICYACDERGSVEKLAKHLGSGKPQVHYTPEDVLDEVADAVIADREPLRRNLPESWLIQFDHHTDYWNKRRISTLMQRRFGLGYDPFADAATIPLRDSIGHLQGVTRRFLCARHDGPKYKYPKGFDVRQNLFAASMLVPGEVVVLCEGQIDAMRVWCAGYQAVAIFGSSFSHKQGQILRTVDPCEVVIFTDNDDAGSKAADIVAEELRGLPLSMATYSHVPADIDDPGKMTNAQIERAIESAERRLT